jgi:hypothetical protein
LEWAQRIRLEKDILAINGFDERMQYGGQENWGTISKLALSQSR